MNLLKNCARTGRALILLFCLGTFLPTNIEAQAQGLTERPRGTTQAFWGYVEHLPVGYSTEDKTTFPLLIALHGVGEAGNGSSELNRVLKHGPAKLINHDQWPADRPFIVIAPQSPGGFFNPTKLYNFIEQMKKDYQVDENRIYLTGLSAGGISIWNYLAKYQNQITAAVPIAGKGQIIRNDGVHQLAKLPIWAFHGSNDGTVGVNGSIIPIEFLRSRPGGSSSTSKLTIYSGVGHDSWSRTYDLKGMSSQTDGKYDAYDVDIYTWLLSHTKGQTTNQPPTVTVEADQTITLPTNMLTLVGEGRDAEGSVSYAWSQSSGPSLAVLTGANTPELTIDELREGIYTFRLTVTDEANAISHGDVSVTVEPASVAEDPAPAPSPPNPAPAPTPIPAPIADSDCNCDHTITPAKTYVNGQGLDVQPGDVICLQAGKYEYLNLYNFRGTAEQPLTFINCGGQVEIGGYQWHYGFVMNNNQHFRLTGTGDTDYEYGIRIDGIKDNASGFAISTYSSDFEIDHLEISNTGFAGMHIVMKPTCDPASQKGNYVMRNINIHDNYVHDTHGEGLYIGHSKYTGTTVTCDGEKKTVYPHTVEGIRVHNNTIERTGWDGFQVSCAVKDCEIYRNTVKDYGRENKSSQRAGIVIGGGSTGRLYDNLIYRGTGGGIHVFGIGDNLIYNNIIVEAGEDGVFIGDKTTEAGRSYSVLNNTIVSPGRDGIRMYNKTSSRNQFLNNLIVNPGSYNDYSKSSKAFVYLNSSEIDVTIDNNVFKTDVSEMSFVDPAQQDFRLQETSPAIDAGADVVSFGFDKDYNGLIRRVGSGVDAGACEYQEISTAPTPNPAQNEGLTYSYYEGIWDRVPDFTTLSPVKTGQVASFDLSPRDQDDFFAFQFEGVITIETLGKYTFYTSSDDGSILYINNKLVVDNDGLHALREEEGTVELNEGQHSIKVVFFEKRGNQTLNVKYEGPGIAKQEVPARVLSTNPQSAPVLPSAEPTSPEATGRILVNFNFDQDAPAPWNNTSVDPRYTKEFLNLSNEQGEETEVGLTITTPWGQGYLGSYNDKGEVTGDNSGVHPDMVMKTSYWIGTDRKETLKISGLAPHTAYRFTLFASRKGTGNRSTQYSIGQQTVTLNASGNTSEEVALVADSDSEGSIYINVQRAEGAKYGYLNAMVIEQVWNAEAQKNSVQNPKASELSSVEDKVESAFSTMQIYPNPVVDQLHIKVVLSNKTPIAILIKDLAGNTVVEGSFESNLNNEFILDLSHLKSGIHGVLIVYQNYTKQFKIVKN